MSPTKRAMVAAWVIGAVAGAAMCAEPTSARLEPDPRAQSAIEETVSAVVRSDESAAERFAALQRLGERDRAALLLQMALYLENASGTDREMAGAIVLRRLAFTSKETIETVAPRLGEADPSLRRVLSGMLAAVDRSEGGEADFRVYDAWLAGRGRPPAALVAYLYEASPEAAVHCLQRVYGRTAPLASGSSRALDDLKTIVAGRDVSRPLTGDERTRATAAVATLAGDPAWWVRRYAAAVVGGDAALGTPAIFERLRGDSDPLVREGLTRAPGSPGPAGAK